MIHAWVLIWCSIMVNPGTMTVVDPTSLSCLDEKFNLYSDSATLLNVFDQLPPAQKATAQIWNGTKYDAVVKDVSTKYDLHFSSK